jgi:hypothetical protein
MKSPNPPSLVEAARSNSATPYRVGFWAALVAFAGTLGFSIVQIMQIMAFLHPPLDGILIYGFSLCIATPFMIAMLALHYVTPEGNRIWSHAALLLAVMYAVYVNLNYVVQLATVIPLSLRGSLDEIRILDQTPHSLFWDVDALGYIFMGLATLFAFPVFANTGLEKWVKSFFLANGLVVPIISFVYFYPTFSTGILLLGSVWIVTALGSVLLLTLFFGRKLRPALSSG